MRKNNLKITALLTSAILAASMLTACGGNNSNVANQPTEPAVNADESLDTQGKDATASDDEQKSEDVSKDQNSQETSSGSAEANASDKTAENSTGSDAGSDNNASASDMITKVENSDISAKDSLIKNESALPPYEYPGPELFYSVVYKYVTDVLGNGYLEGDVTIPCPIIVEIDDSDKSDIKVYGDFRVYNYTLSDDKLTLFTVSGGSHPGLIHMKQTDGGDYEVTDFDAVGDGSNFESTAKKIFGDHYDAFSKVYSDENAREEIRGQIISNYAAANNLNITGFQDYGWEKKALPTENIDTFYSTF